MSIYKGNTIGTIYKGSTKIGKVYKGSTLVYESEVKCWASPEGKPRFICIGSLAVGAEVLTNTSYPTSKDNYTLKSVDGTIGVSGSKVYNNNWYPSAFTYRETITINGYPLHIYEYYVNSRYTFLMFISPKQQVGDTILCGQEFGSSRSTKYWTKTTISSVSGNTVTLANGTSKTVATDLIYYRS